MKKKLIILGSTGSIGTQTLNMVEAYPHLFEVVALTAHQNSSLLFEQVRKFKPVFAGLTKEFSNFSVPQDLSFCQFSTGHKVMEEAVETVDAHYVMASVSGVAGLPPVMKAIQKGLDILLANKETLVAGGSFVMEEAKKHQVTLFPVDSEHSAIFQCLQGAGENPIDKIYLTASGGPFRTWPQEDIFKATKAQALKHPNWSMGQKLTVDSASMFNKALEIIEAKWLFNVPEEKIEVWIHPQSILHSAVGFKDGAIIGQMGIPSMHLPILYALSYPKRLPTGDRPLTLKDLANLTFEPQDPKRFPALQIVRDCLKAGNGACCVMNSANEVAVEAFLKEKISFGQIPQLVSAALEKINPTTLHTYQQVIDTDLLTRKITKELLAAL